MHNIQNIEYKVKKIISRQLGIDIIDIYNSMLLSIDLDVNSLDIIELFMVLEKEFKIKFTYEIIKKITTVESIVKFIFLFK